MKRLLPAMLLLASCGPASESPGLFPRYAVLTSIGEESPMYSRIARFAVRRHAPILRFFDIEKNRKQLMPWLRAVRPAFVAVFVRPEDLDALHDAHARVDDLEYLAHAALSDATDKAPLSF